ncbi:MAG TPA: hypothetical protein VGC42_04130 [Kofleriaceae bacterium]
MKQALIVASMMLLSVTAFAGKAEREFMKSDVNPAVKAANEKVKAACGCAMNIIVDEASLSKQDEMYPIKHMAQSIAEEAPKYCTDEASKKAVCKIKTLVLAKTATAEFKFNNGKGIMSTDGQSQCSWDMVTREVDK